MNRKCFLCGVTEYDEQEYQELVKREGRGHIRKKERLIIVTSPYTDNRFCLCERCAKWITKNLINLLL